MPEEIEQIFPHDLFVDENGHPLVFTIPYYPERTKLSRLIKMGGGIVTNISKISSIRLTTNMNGVDHNVHVSYITDCIKKNQLLPIDDYRQKRSTSSVYSSNLLLSPVVPKGKIRYTSEEDEIIKDYIQQHACYENYFTVGGVAIWKKMEKEKITNHTWQSMKQRYLKYLMVDKGYFIATITMNPGVYSDNESLSDSSDNEVDFTPKELFPDVKALHDAAITNGDFGKSSIKNSTVQSTSNANQSDHQINSQRSPTYQRNNTIYSVADSENKSSDLDWENMPGSCSKNSTDGDHDKDHKFDLDLIGSSFDIKIILNDALKESLQTVAEVNNEPVAEEVFFPSIGSSQLHSSATSQSDQVDRESVISANSRSENSGIGVFKPIVYLSGSDSNLMNSYSSRNEPDVMIVGDSDCQSSDNDSTTSQSSLTRSTPLKFVKLNCNHLSSDSTDRLTVWDERCSSSEDESN